MTSWDVRSGRVVDGFKAAGSYDAAFDARGLTSGVYIYRLQAGRYHEVRKMVVLK